MFARPTSSSGLRGQVMREVDAARKMWSMDSMMTKSRGRARRWDIVTVCLAIVAAGQIYVEAGAVKECSNRALHMLRRAVGRRYLSGLLAQYCSMRSYTLSSMSLDGR